MEYSVASIHLIEVLSICIAIIALVFTLLRDFILPCIIKPKIKVYYSNKEPYKKDNLIINETCHVGSFIRIMINNEGKTT
ncbi:MAG: hypothetical protein V2A56_07570, partial [bacterium]